MTSTRPTTLSDRDVIEAVFEDITDGTDVYAVGDWACCLSCGHHSLSELIDTTDHESWIFWHAQDDDQSFDESGNLVEPLYLAFSDRRAARTAIRWLLAAGYNVDWNGDERRRVAVYTYSLLVDDRSRSTPG
jgi:hypothetical protein